jgi:hypothetical protein
VDGEQWQKVYEALNGAGIPSMQARFDEMFVVKEDVKSVTEEAEKKKETKKRTARKPAGKGATEKATKTKRSGSTGRKKTP